MEQLPVGESFGNPQEPCGPEEECSNEDYRGWWAQGNKLYDFLNRMPRHYAERVGMGKMYDQLLLRWNSEISGPDQLGDVVGDSTLGTLLLWIRQSETLIYYVTYQDQGTPTPGPTTPGRLEVEDSLRTTEWHWPWIEGWDDVATRNRIVNPQKEAKWTVKRIVLIGAGVGAAIYAGKKLFGGDSDY
jgi:hypothetical protein